jgi:hypothetical protein
MLGPVNSFSKLWQTLKKIKKEKPQAPSLKRVRQYVTLTQDVGARQFGH